LTETGQPSSGPPHDGPPANREPPEDRGLDDVRDQSEPSALREPPEPDEAAERDEAPEPEEALEPEEPPQRERPPARPGLRTFTLEGRAAPGLFLVGWLCTIMGFGLVVVGGLAEAGPFKTLVFAIGLALLGTGLVAGAGSQGLDRRAHGDAYAGPSPFLAFAAVIPLTFLVALIVFRPLVALGLRPEAPLATLVGITIQALVYGAVVRLLVVGLGALRWSEMGLSRPAAEIVVDVARGAVLAVPVLFATVLVAALLVGLLGTRPESPLPPAGNTLDVVINLISAAIVAPIGEEIFCRGFATTAWARTYGANRAIVQGALFFALAHVLTVNAVDFSEGSRQALIAFVVRIPVAVTLGWLFLSRRSIYASLGLHSAFNAIALLLSQLP
jgi:membrane protease YdiL (CAAX protease family)